MSAPDAFDYDWLVMGSGFGGSVSSLRLAEKGYRVGIIESGSRFDDGDFAERLSQVKKTIFAPKLGLRGIRWRAISVRCVIDGM